MTGLLVPRIDPDADTLTSALAYAEAGWYVGYTDPSCHDPKSPEVMGKGWQTKTSQDPQTIVGWYAARNLGVFLHVGRSGAWVADVDHPEHMPDVLADACNWAPYQSTRPDTPGRGHYIFTQPPGLILGNSTGKLGKGWGEARAATVSSSPGRHHTPTAATTGGNASAPCSSSPARSPTYSTTPPQPKTPSPTTN